MLSLFFEELIKCVDCNGIVLIPLGILGNPYGNHLGKLRWDNLKIKKKMTKFDVSSEGESYLERVTKNGNSNNTPNDELYSILKLDNKQFY